MSILKENPKYGIYLGKDCYKIRLAITSKGKGKSSGARIITHYAIVEETLFLLSIYEKSEKESITDGELQEMINEIS